MKGLEATLNKFILSVIHHHVLYCLITNHFALYRLLYCAGAAPSL